MIDKHDKLHTVSAYLADRSNSDLTYSQLLHAAHVKIGHVDFPLQMLKKVDKTAKYYWFLLDYRNIMKQKNFVSYVSKLKSYNSKNANVQFSEYMITHTKLAYIKLSEISTEDAINIIDEHIVLIRQANADAQIKEKIKLVDEL